MQANLSKRQIKMKYFIIRTRNNIQNWFHKASVVLKQKLTLVVMSLIKGLFIYSIA